MMPVELSPQSEVDLAGIWSHIANDNRQAANRVLDLIERRMQSIGKFSRIGEACPGLGKDLRCFWVGNYGIFYRIKTDAIEIVRVLHGAQDLAAIFRK
jgi:toxin ParE1/3/4